MYLHVCLKWCRSLLVVGQGEYWATELDVTRLLFISRRRQGERSLSWPTIACARYRSCVHLCVTSTLLRNTFCSLAVTSCKSNTPSVTTRSHSLSLLCVPSVFSLSSNVSLSPFHESELFFQKINKLKAATNEFVERVIQPRPIRHNYLYTHTCIRLLPRSLSLSKNSVSCMRPFSREAVCLGIIGLSLNGSCLTLLNSRRRFLQPGGEKTKLLKITPITDTLRDPLWSWGRCNSLISRIQSESSLWPRGTVLGDFKGGF